MGSLDFRELGSVALGTVGVGKGECEIGNGRIKRENPAEIAIANHPHPTDLWGQCSRNSTDMYAVFQISTANSGWGFGCCVARVRPRGPEMDFLQAGDTR